MSDFWISSGHHLLDRSDGGGLVVTDEFLKAFLARPELVPPPEACPVELGVHAQLLSAPRQTIAPEEIALMQDADARENWRVFLDFRDKLASHPTIEAAYIDLIRNGVGETPPLFLNQLVHLILRNALDGETDAYRLRAAELFFRPQRMSVHEGAVLLADEETIAGHEDARAASPLMTMLGGPPVEELDVLNDDNAATYPARSDAFDMALDFRRDSRGRAALGEVVARWVRHLLAVDVDLQSHDAFEGEWQWFVGLDQEGARIGNALWTGEGVGEDEDDLPLAIYRLTFSDPDIMMRRVRGVPVWLILGVTKDRIVRLKPQNLVVGLPLEMAHA